MIQSDTDFRVRYGGTLCSWVGGEAVDSAEGATKWGRRWQGAMHSVEEKKLLVLEMPARGDDAGGVETGVHGHPKVRSWGTRSGSAPPSSR